MRRIEHVVDYPVQGVALFRSERTELLLSDIYWRWLFDDLRRAASLRSDLASFVAELDEQDGELVAAVRVTQPLVDYLRHADPASSGRFELLVPSHGSSIPTAEQVQALIVDLFSEALSGTVEIEFG